MTTQILTTELSNLIQDSKRKNSELKNASESSLNDLKSLPSTSEAQVAADLSRRPKFITPFLLACGTHNVKFTTSAVICLQRLAVSQGLPPERLKEVLEAFREATSLNLDIQLKILQALPTLLQNYADGLKGELLGSALHVCSILQSSKTRVVNNTAAATMLQLLAFVFEKVVAEDKTTSDVPTVEELSGRDGPIHVRAAALDAYRIFNDFCLLINGQKPQFLRLSAMPQSFGLELIESVMSNNTALFLSHAELTHVLRIRLLPLVIKSLSEGLDFPLAVRMFRVLQIMIRRHIDVLVPECGVALGLLTQMLDPESTMPWERALCMELFKGVYAESGLTRKIYAFYDEDEDGKPLLRDQLAALVRLSSEKPAVIGLGYQSAAPVGQPMSKDTLTEQAAVEAGGVAGIIGGAIGLNDSNTVGISIQWSLLRVPCMDQLDKAEPPALPESYIYSMALTCINSFSEDLARFILPLTMPGEGRGKKKGRPVTAAEDVRPQSSNGDNSSLADPQQRTLPRRQSYKKVQIPLSPLTLDSHPCYSEIRTAAAMVENCWPAVLATCSTFLKATLDSEYFHSLVRAFQKFAHVAGLLRLSTPRDAFLTTLGKAAVPPSVFAVDNSSAPNTPSVESSNLFANAKGLLSVESIVGHSSASLDRTRQSPAENGVPALNTRNLLCLRALLNLGIALGPTLDKAWSIVLGTLQQADFVIFASSRRSGPPNPHSSPQGDGQTGNNNASLTSNFGSEISAVETAASRMLQSTIDFPNDSFRNVLVALCDLLGEAQANGNDIKGVHRANPTSPTSMQLHRRLSSMSGMSTSTVSHVQEMHFVLVKIGDLAKINMTRLTSNEPDESGWNIFTTKLISVACSTQLDPAVRLRASEVLSGILVGVTTVITSNSRSPSKDIQMRVLSALKNETTSLCTESRDESSTSQVVDLEVHRTALEALKMILERSGASLVAGWDLVLDIIMSAFETNDPSAHSDVDCASIGSAFTPAGVSRGRSSKVIRTSFGSLQLICSDYLSSLPNSCMLSLIRTLFRFCSQNDDLNISLTTITFFWNVSDFLQGQGHTVSLGIRTLKATNEEQLLDVTGSKDPQESRGALWLLLLLRLTGMMTDQRSEVRNGAVQTLLRIFDAYGNLLTLDSWSCCLKTVVFKMMATISGDQQRSASSENLNTQQRSGAWSETTILIIEGVVGLFASYLDVFAQQQDFVSTWQTLMKDLGELLDRHPVKLSASIYSALELLLTKVENVHKIGQPSVDLVYELWVKQVPGPEDSASNVKASSEDALVNHIKMFKELYRSLKGSLTPARANDILKTLRKSIQRTEMLDHLNASESLTTLQAKIMDVLENFRTDIPGVPSAMLSFLSESISLAFKESLDGDVVKEMGFLAFSKSSVRLLQAIIVRHREQDDIYRSSAVVVSLEALVRPIAAKYQQPLEVKSPPSWALATSSAIGIIQATLPVLRDVATDVLIREEYWKRVISIIKAVIVVESPHTLSSAEIVSDQDFDVDSFDRLRSLISPALGTTSIPDTLRRQYAGHIFSSSIIHQPAFGELPQPGEELLEGLYRSRIGRTYNPPPAQRSRISYACLDELFSLVAIHDSSPERVKLAQAAAPYLILRIALTLRGYIFDQPLRGRMPQPASQRRELLYILQALIDLKSEPRAIPDAPGVSSQHRKHLHRLFPLVTKAVRVAARDEKVLNELQRVFEVVGEEFGID
ncbi:MAG: hypothetical protein M1835_007604 [Candelina submexicana]|nr:MAG: hypothetical protein M1835_007604 [Candelina submexicana]